MEWSQLLISNRLSCPKEDHQDKNRCRSQFERDFDRIIFSSAFRRLNGKTQVFPFPNTDLIHTRLTHSLETASVGRSLGTIVGNAIDLKGATFSVNLGSIVSAACLAHDIGNPPFGHSGEKAISTFFKSERGCEILLKSGSELNELEIADFQEFEGNAMGFHVLTYRNPKKEKAPGGLRLTLPTLAAFSKYPRPSKIENKSEGISEHKPGIFQSDLGCFSEIAKGLGMVEKNGRWYRHPLAFLTEAADDICYTVMDFEDGYKNGLITFDLASKCLKAICETEIYKDEILKVKNIIDKREKIGFLRAKAIDSLIHQAADVFIENEKEILAGEFDKSLLDNIKTQKAICKINKITKKDIYTYKPVIQVEAAGYKVLPGLLETFLNEIIKNRKNGKKGKKEESKILELIPKEYKFNFKNDTYNAIMGITMYISGMTDHYAVDIYRNLQGIQLPNY